MVPEEYQLIVFHSLEFVSTALAVSPSLWNALPRFCQGIMRELELTGFLSSMLSSATQVKDDHHIFYTAFEMWDDQEPQRSWAMAQY